MPVKPAGRALVTDGRRASALAVVRSLGRRGFDVVVADPGPDAPAWASRYATARLRYPDPTVEPDAAAEAILDAVRRLGIDLLVPVTDEVALPLMARRDDWPADTIVTLPAPDAAAVAWDKARTLELARRLGVPVPRTVVATTPDEARAAADALGWPIVLKPARSRRYRPGHPIAALHVGYANEPAEIDRPLDRHDWSVPMLVQAWYPGTGEGVELLLRDGDATAIFQHRRLREVPVTGGASAYREAVALDPDLVRYACDLLRELAWSGLAMVEFKIGRDGPRLMEINGRVWGSLPLAVAAGVDFPAGLSWAHAPAAGDPPPVAGGAYRVGRRAHNLELEAVWIGSVALGRNRLPYLHAIPRRAALGAALSLLRPGDAYDTFARDDRRPFAVEMRRVARLVRGVAGRGRAGA
jgi:predicted ATP-grasp superfamily ATP-dependent carboligase